MKDLELFLVLKLFLSNPFSTSFHLPNSHLTFSKQISYRRLIHFWLFVSDFNGKQAVFSVFLVFFSFLTSFLSFFEVLGFLEFPSKTSFFVFVKSWRAATRKKSPTNCQQTLMTNSMSVILIDFASVLVSL